MREDRRTGTHRHFTPTTGNSRVRKDRRDCGQNAVVPKHIQDLQIQAARLIFCNGWPLEIDSKVSGDLFHTLKSEFPLPTYDQLTSRYLSTVYKNYKAQVKGRLAEANWLNVILDAPEWDNGRKILNVSVQMPHGVAFYWATINLQPVGPAPPSVVQLLRRVLIEITESNLDRINSFTCNTCNTTETMQQEASQSPDLMHCFWMPVDSHGLWLLSRDILDMPEFASTVKEANTLMSVLSTTYVHGLQVTPSGISHWDTYIPSLFSIEANEAALRTQFGGAEVTLDVDQAVIIEMITIINNPGFWTQLRNLLSILKPIYEALTLTFDSLEDRWDSVKRKWDSLRSSMHDNFAASLQGFFQAWNDIYISSEHFYRYQHELRNREQRLRDGVFHKLTFIYWNSRTLQQLKQK